MTLLTGEFYRQLKALNPRLRVCCFENNNRLAGLYYVDREGGQDLCGVDKQFVPEYTEYDSAGHIVKSGWRRVYLMLLRLNMTTVQKIRRVCPGFFLHWTQAAVDEDRRAQLPTGDPIAAKMLKMAESAPIVRWRDPETGKIEEGTALTVDQNMELAADIRAKDSELKKEETEKERWFLETWAARGGNKTDKPNL